MKLDQISQVDFKQICESAVVLNNAQSVYDDHWRKYMIAAESNPLNEDRFWEIVVEFRNLISYAKKINRAEPPKWAADELLRSSLVDHNSKVTFDEAVHFALNWRIYVSKFYKAADKSEEIKWGLSDDGFGDLMDGLVLCGKDFLNRLKNDEFEGRKHFRREASEILGDLSEMVLDGENYFAMNLEDQAQKRFRSFVRYLEEAA